MHLRVIVYLTALLAVFIYPSFSADEQSPSIDLAESSEDDDIYYNAVDELIDPSEEIMSSAVILRRFLSDAVRRMNASSVARTKKNLEDLALQRPQLMTILLHPYRLKAALAASNLPISKSKSRKYFPQAFKFALRLSSVMPRGFNKTVDWVASYLSRKHSETHVNLARQRWVKAVQMFKYRLVKHVFLSRHIRQFSLRLIKEVKMMNLTNALNVKHLLEVLNLNGIPSELRTAFDYSIRTYFENIDISIRQKMISNVLLLPPNADQTDMMMAAIHAAGPGFQKLFQLLGQRISDESFQKKMKELKSRIKPMKQWEVQRVMALSFRQLNINYTIQFPCIGSASVGQVHFGTYKDLDAPTDGIQVPEDIVYKVKRRGVDAKVQMEIFILRQVATEYPMLKNVFEQVKQSLRLEMNLTRELEMMQLGREKYIDSRARIYVPMGYFAHRSVIGMERISGVPLSELVLEDQYACSLRDQLRLLMDTWFKEAIFGSGFYHGDLHDGNMLYEQSDAPVLTVLDFGNAHILSPNLQQTILKFAIFIQTRNEGYTQEIMFQWIDKHLPADVMSKIKEDLTLLISTLYQEKQNGIRRPSKEIANILFEEGIRAGLKVPAGFVNFMRARMLFERQIKEFQGRWGEVFQRVGCPLASSEWIYRQVALRHVRSCTSDVVRGMMNSNFGKLLMERFATQGFWENARNNLEFPLGRPTSPRGTEGCPIQRSPGGSPRNLAGPMSPPSDRENRGVGDGYESGSAEITPARSMEEPDLLSIPEVDGDEMPEFVWDRDNPGTRVVGIGGSMIERTSSSVSDESRPRPSLFGRLSRAFSADSPIPPRIAVPVEEQELKPLPESYRPYGRTDLNGPWDESDADDFMSADESSFRENRGAFLRGRNGGHRGTNL